MRVMSSSDGLFALNLGGVWVPIKVANNIIYNKGQQEII